MIPLAYSYRKSKVFCQSFSSYHLSLSDSFLRIYYFIFIFTVFRPVILQKIHSVNAILDLLFLLCSVYIIINYAIEHVAKKDGINDVFILCCFNAYLLVNTLIQKADSYSAMVLLYKILVMYMFLENNRMKFIIVFRMTYMIFSSLLILNLVFFLIYPNGIMNVDLSGVIWLSGNKNGLPAIVASYYFLGQICRIVSRKKSTILDSILLVIMLTLNILIWSATTLFSVSVTLIFLYCMPNKNKKYFSPNKIMLYTIIITFLIIYANIQNYFSLLIVNILRKDLLLSGRVNLWQRSINAISKSLLFGYGLEDASTMHSRIKLHTTTNGWLEVLYNSGLVGLFLCIITLYTMNSKVKNIHPDNYLLKNIINSSLVFHYLRFIAERPLTGSGSEFIFYTLAICMFIDKSAIYKNNTVLKDI